MEKTEVKPKLTKFERAFVEAIHQQFWIARDCDGGLYLYFYKPDKHGGFGYWISFENDGAGLKEDMFLFITWESGKVWSRDDLLALEVEEDTPAEKTAEEMFEALGFRQVGQDNEIYSKNNICYINGNAKIEFNKKEKSYIAWEYKKILLAYEISLDIYLAIHQQMKELGWIE